MGAGSAPQAVVAPRIDVLASLHDQANRINEALTLAALAQQGIGLPGEPDSEHSLQERFQNLYASVYRKEAQGLIDEIPTDAEREQQLAELTGDDFRAATYQRVQQQMFGTGVALPGDAATRYKDMTARRSSGTSR